MKTLYTHAPSGPSGRGQGVQTALQGLGAWSQHRRPPPAHAHTCSFKCAHVHTHTCMRVHTHTLSQAMGEAHSYWGLHGKGLIRTLVGASLGGLESGRLGAPRESLFDTGLCQAHPPLWPHVIRGTLQPRLNLLGTHSLRK